VLGPAEGELAGELGGDRAVPVELGCVLCLSEEHSVGEDEVDLHRDRSGGGLAGDAFDEVSALICQGERAWPPIAWVPAWSRARWFQPLSSQNSNIQSCVPSRLVAKPSKDNTILRTTFLFTMWVETLEGRESSVGPFVLQKSREVRSARNRISRRHAPPEASWLPPSITTPPCGHANRHRAAVLPAAMVAHRRRHVLDDATDWDEVAELVTESYRLLRSLEAEALP
jgi:hypothetical protein